jgi:DNA-binding SARP family transcriptional activator
MRQRILLGALLAHANQPVRVEHLAEIVWDGAPPGRAVPTLRTYVARLRQDLGPDAASCIRTRDGGYLAEVGPGELDALVFEGLCHDAGDAAAAADWAGASDRAARALAMWRGAPLGDAPSQALRDAWLPHLDQQRLQVTEWRIEAELHLGRHEHLVAQLRRLTADHPLRERFHAQLMLALYRCGRQAEALAAYQDARTTLVEELGVEPGRELRHLHERILAEDRDADGDPIAAQLRLGLVAQKTLVAVPRQLPAAPGYFTGRDGELELITGLRGLSPQPDAYGGTVVISAIDGMAGIGKTALAVQAAHRLAGKFPDGQLFTDLHGYTQGYPPSEPGEALRSLLRVLGVPAARIPDQTEERAALYRQLLAGTQTLILLDNALDEAQVRPLLPAAAGCLVIITSRRRLRGLHDANVVALDVLPEADALTLLRTLIAPAEAAAEADLNEVAGLCGRLPLALRIAGALLRHRPAWTPGYLAGLLRDEHHRLAALTDAEHDISALFDLSYHGLAERQRRLFRRLALVPGPEFDAFAAAALLDADLAAAAGLLEDLVDHNLLIEHAPGRYRLHDLIRTRARTLADGDPRPDRDDALDRLLRYYAYTAQRSSAFIAPYPRPVLENPAPARTPALEGPREAWTWLRAERESIEAACDHARGLTWDDHVVTLTAALSEILRTDGPLARALDLHQAAADIAGRHGWPAARSTALTDLASTRALTGDLAGAAAAAAEGLEVSRAAGHRLGEAAALSQLGRVRLMTGDIVGAAEAATAALEVFRAVGNRLGEAAGLTELGRMQILTGDFADAAAPLTRALEIFRAVGNSHGEAAALTQLVVLRRTMGDFAGAAEVATQALAIFRAVGNWHGEADTLTALGRVRRMTRDLAGAAEAVTRALGIYRDVGSRYGEAYALTELGRIRLAAGDATGAEADLFRALGIYRASGSRNGEGWALNFYAAAVAASGDHQRALGLYRQALGMNRELKQPDDEAGALEGTGECHLSAGQAEAGVAYLNEALEIYERLGMRPDVQRVHTRLADLATG